MNFRLPTAAFRGKLSLPTLVEKGLQKPAEPARPVRERARERESQPASPGREDSLCCLQTHAAKYSRGDAAPTKLLSPRPSWDARRKGPPCR